MDPGVIHPENSFETRGGTRQEVEAYALIRWERSEQGIEVVAVAVRQLPDGEWEHLFPIEAACDLRPGGFIDHQTP